MEEDITRLGERELNEVRQKFGVLFQGAALLDSMTLYDNCRFPFARENQPSESEIRKRVEERLAQVGLAGMGCKYPAEVSGGMKNAPDWPARLGTRDCVVRRRAHDRIGPLVGQEHSPAHR